MLRRIAERYSRHARLKRAALLRSELSLEPQHVVLDLGGGTGEHFHMIWPNHRNVVVADVSESDLQTAREKFGYGTTLLGASERLPFRDREFDLVFCSSVLEHATGPKQEMISLADTAEFERRAWASQSAFASEIRRIGKRYWVQTPYRYFLIESHSWLPGIIIFLPRPLLIRLLKLVGRFWPKKTLPDWNLLTAGQMRKLFPGARIAAEYSLGMVKSLIAISIV
ncbi:MAG: class I SAM-dependent methyltransferase [Pseudomonadota bacterium]|nr:class I SAM-dependent methyltransferase [Pseudomonadota bacterium]